MISGLNAVCSGYQSNERAVTDSKRNEKTACVDFGLQARLIEKHAAPRRVASFQGLRRSVLARRLLTTGAGCQDMMKRFQGRILRF